MKKFILGLVLSLYLISPSIAYPSIAAEQFLQQKLGSEAEIVQVSTCYQKYLAKHKDGSVWLYKVYKAKPSGKWHVEGTRIFKK